MKTRSYNNALILGMGISGFAAAKLLLSEGGDVTIVDRDDSDILCKRGDELFVCGANVHLEVASLDLVIGDQEFDICIISPGISEDDIWANIIRQKEITIISELELGASRLKLPMVAVTGSNGKSTFVKLCGDMFAQNGINPVLAGNYGKPLCEAVLEQDKYDWAVVEVSSFQLEHIVHFCPDIAVLLNIEPDHLDRHGCMDTYIELKSRIINQMSHDKLALVHDEIISEVQELTSGTPKWQSIGCNSGAVFRYVDEAIEAESGNILKLHKTVFANEITGLTAAAVFAISEYLSLDCNKLRRALVDFESLPHRMQIISDFNGVLFIDDSKATNIAALTAALKMSTRPVRLIVGGQLKEKDILKPKELLKSKVKSVYCIGESALIFKTAWGDAVKCYLCGDIDAAVEQAWRDSESGDVVLLSPGCASFDQFCNYKERGIRFKEIVKGVLGRKTK